MSLPILPSKLFIPGSDQLIARPHLFEQLNNGLGRKLILVTAPAGSGKTSLVSAWLREIKVPVAWLSLDGTDGDPGRFVTYIVAACQKIEPTIGQRVLDLLQAPQSPRLDTMMTLLLDDLSHLSHNDCLLVLDDYHLIEELSIHEGLRFLLDHLPPQMHLVVITREDPPFPLPKLRVRQQLTELRVRDLRFTIPEISAFFNQNSNPVQLSTEEIAALARRTEGWIAGLQLAAISLQNNPDPSDFIKNFAGDDRYIVDYLFSEVLEQQPSHVLDFLQQTSILKRFTANLCQAVSAQSRANEILAYLEEANLFLVPLDNRREWYRYHHLFGDLLSHRLKQTSPSQIPKLHRLASRWYQEHGFMEDAMHHALTAEDYDYAADLIEQVGLKMRGQGRLNQLQQWMVALPETYHAERPYLSLLLAFRSVLNMQAEKAEAHLSVAEPLISKMADNSKLKSEIMCQMSLLRGYISRLQGEIAASTRYLQEAAQWLPDHGAVLHCSVYLNLGTNHWILGNFSEAEAPFRQAITFLNQPDTVYPAFIAAAGLTNLYRQQGRLNEIGRLHQQLAQQLPPAQRSHLAKSFVAAEEGPLLYEKNELTAATESINQALETSKNLDRTINVSIALLILAWIKHVNGQRADIEPLLAQANANRQPFVVEFDYYQVRLWLAMGNLEAASRWARAYEQAHKEIKPWQALIDLTYAHILFAENQLEQTLKTLEQCEAATRSIGAMNWVVRSLALKAVCYQARHDRDQALHSLQQALTLAEPEGYCRTFIDMGLPMQRLLHQAATQGIATNYISHLLNNFPHSSADKPTPNLAEPLTEREHSILRLMAVGRSNREIAEKLFLSVNTIKWYSTHIYRKLGVNSRTEAVAQAREAGIL
jgi:LuxR family maltose regulon positive regulatory protein